MRKVTRIVNSIQLAEGGDWNDPIGGPTRFGITLTTLTRLREKHPSLPAELMDLDFETAGAIIESEYITKRNIDKLPYMTALVQGHMSVMSWEDGIIIMQERLGVKADGLIGPVTLRAVDSLSALAQVEGNIADIRKFLATRKNGYASSYETRLSSLLA